jgi:Winged helix DNA-binding domain
MDVVSNRALNRWTLARQLLVERAAIDPVTAVERLAGMQAQHSPSPYIGLWSRLEGFEREHLERAVLDDRVIKATLNRGTLHLVTAERLPAYRIATGAAYYDTTLRRLVEMGADLDAVRAGVVAAVRERPYSRPEIARLVLDLLPFEAPDWARERPTAISGVAVTTDLCNLAEDALYGWFGGGRYRVAPPAPPVEPAEAFRRVATDYLLAYGPATRADLASWTGRTVQAFKPALESLDLVTAKAEDGRTLLDLPGAARPPADMPVPVRFLPKWDSVLLAHANRERVVGDAERKAVVAKNGDVAATFLVDGVVCGTWTATTRARAVLSLVPLVPLAAGARREVEAEGERLLAWLRPDAAAHEVRWQAG